MEKNETKRRTRSSDAKLLAFWETLTRDQQLRALRVLCALTGVEMLETPTLSASTARVEPPLR
mgnify:CR=1 FL=1